MPELPEVHTTATSLNRLLKGAIIRTVWTDYGGTIHHGKENIKDRSFFRKFREMTAGAGIVRVDRRGKNVLIHLSTGNTLLIHMKMTGHLLVGRYVFDGNIWRAEKSGPLSEPINQFIHLVFSLMDGRALVLSDLRKFAKVTATQTAQLDSHTDLKDLGPDPTQRSFSLQEFTKRLLRRPEQKIKTVLLDQTVLAGIGNIYSDEILWAGGVHPNSKTGKIPAKNIRLLFDATKTILKKVFYLEVTRLPTTATPRASRDTSTTTTARISAPGRNVKKEAVRALLYG